MPFGAVTLWRVMAHDSSETGASAAPVLLAFQSSLPETSVDHDWTSRALNLRTILIEVMKRAVNQFWVVN